MLEIIEQPGIRVVDLAQVKTHLRVDSDIEDSYIGGLISAATQAIENYLNKSLITQRLRYVYTPTLTPAFAKFLLPKGPVIKVEAACVVSHHTKIPLKRYCLSKNGIFEAHVPLNASVEVIYQAGFGTYQKDIPEVIQHAVMLLVAEFFETRTLKNLNDFKNIKELLSPYRARQLV